jgi:hypothetical protein
MAHVDPGNDTPRSASLALTTRTGFATVMAVVGVIAVSCQGNNCYTPAEPVAVSGNLAPFYVVTSVNETPVPVRYADSATTHLIVVSDSLHLTFTDSTYQEAGSVLRVDTVSGTQETRRYQPSGSTRFSHTGTASFTFPRFLGGSATAVVNPAPGFGILTLTTPAGQRWLFRPLAAP